MKISPSMTYNIITLKNGEFTAKINVDRGANLFSLRNDSKGVSILREPNYDLPLDNPYLYGAPLLFPVNRISGGAFKFEGRDYVFPINEEKTNCHLHGVLHQIPFKVEKLSKSRAVLSYTATANSPYLAFPHEFRVKVSYVLTCRGIKVKTQFLNLSTTNMPVMFGYHTTFNAKFIKGCEPLVRVGFCDEIERNMQNYLPTGKLLDFDGVSKALIDGKFNPLSQPISRHYKCKNNGNIAIFDKNSKMRVEYKNSKNLNFRLIYNGNADEYICLEPQNAMANAVNAPQGRDYGGFTYIKPDRKITFKSEILLLKD
ncbi:MAG: aldose 1-epimerase [Clostridia bacterium]|nr:aldose 1-epimerase [Clostridia bacterium]